MKRGIKIIRNAIRCKCCGEILDSKYVHDFVPCKCFKESGGAKGCAADGGLEYCKRVGNPTDWEELSETRPFTDEEVDAYNKNRREMYEQYGWVVDKMEK